MLRKVIDFPAQLSIAVDIARRQALSIQPVAAKISNILILGMGGSGIAGEFARILLKHTHLPIHVCKTHVPPHYVNQGTFVIAVTFSGKTTETLDAFNSAIQSGAQGFMITSSSELKGKLDQRNIPCIVIPPNHYSRASLGYMLMPILEVLKKIIALPKLDSDIKETISILETIKEECKPENPMKSNSAQLLATALSEKLPIIYAESGFTDVIALRWKQQLNENSKIPCYYDVFPELLHNEIEVWNSYSLANDNRIFILLRDALHEKDSGIEQVVKTAKDLAISKGFKIFELWSRGNSELARLLSLSYLGDFVSVYLASVRGIDPTQIPNIEHVKKAPLEMINKER
jgi:glucose/mannose-6-phosphate isomerase